jgi:hypothetical protein
VSDKSKDWATRMSRHPVGHVEHAIHYDWPDESGPFTLTRTEVLGRFDTRDEVRAFMVALSESEES